MPSVVGRRSRGGKRDNKAKWLTCFLLVFGLKVFFFYLFILVLMHAVRERHKDRRLSKTTPKNDMSFTTNDIKKK